MSDVFANELNVVRIEKFRNSPIKYTSGESRDIYVDIDGTLANAEHRLHYLQVKPKNWKQFFAEQINDTPYDDIVWLVRLLYENGNRIIICTGRPSEWRSVCEEWLIKHNIPYDALYMRSQGDFRDDSIVKIELVEQMRSEGFDPTIAFDDRDRVVEALRSIGMRVLQVRKGDF